MLTRRPPQCTEPQPGRHADADLVQRLFAQIAQVLEINRLRAVTAEVVETARESLVIGP